jgi:hypothetical protein
MDKKEYMESVIEAVKNGPMSGSIFFIAHLMISGANPNRKAVIKE